MNWLVKEEPSNYHFTRFLAAPVTLQSVKATRALPTSPSPACRVCR